MKIKTALLTIFTLITFSLQSQDCPDIDLIFNSQQEINAYKTTYPNCTFFNYSIRIEGESIHDFTAFDSLTYVGGQLYIGNCDTVSTISAFNNLDSIGGRLTFTSMDSLISLEAFASLQQVYGGIYINYHQNLDTISPFFKLKRISGTYSVSYNKKLRALPVVDSISGISHLAFIHNGILDQVSGAYVLKQPNPNVSLSNFKLKSYEDMDIVAESIKRLSISNHEELTHVKGFITTHTITGELWFYKNEKLQNFEGIESITHVEKQIDLWDNDGLKNCKGMENISGPLDFTFKINENDSLLTLEGMEKITEIKTNVNIYNNASLINLNGLNNLKKIGRNLNISGNESLLSLQGLDNLDTVKNVLSLYNNPNLISLQGLEELDYVESSIRIEGNGLTDISAIGEMDFTNISKLIIADNPDLAVCSVLSICNYLELELSSFIENNAVGCSTLNQVLASCDLPQIDNDNDGFNSDEDCDDTNAEINPGQMEIIYNGLDDDCDTLTLDDDLDLDGFNFAEDCDDTNPDINPDQIEIVYNGIDDDCDTLTLDDDLDLDGFNLAEDCDDENPDINPDAIEIPNNGIDEDCDGSDLISSVHQIEKAGARVFPNPTSDKLYIENFSGNHYIIQSISGRKIKEHVYKDDVIEVGDLLPGLYQIRLFSGKESATQIFVKL